MPVTIHTNADEVVRYAVLTGVVSNDVTANAVRILAHRRTLEVRRNEEQRIAVVAPTDGAFGVARMYQSNRETLGSGTQYLICRTMSEARQWLGLRPIATD